MSDFDLRRPNALSFFRLILACLVIVSHSPELLDGNSQREALKNVFGTLTFGQLAVYGFFFISGFLVVDSAFRSTLYTFMLKRFLRIFPGFAMAYLLSITLVFWLGGGQFDELSASKWAAKASKVLLLLNPAQVGSAFIGSPSPDVNGSLWTIAYEFRCYVLTAIVIFAFGRTILPFLVLAASLALVVAFSLSSGVDLRLDIGNFEPLGNVDDTVRFTMIFCMGALFQIYKEKIPSNGILASASLVMLVAGMYWEQFAAIAVGVFGGYLLLYLAFASASSVWSAINRDADISYGIYLYAWPIQKLLIFYVPVITPTCLTLFTIPLAATAGFLSWHIVEKRALRLRPALRPRLTGRPL